MAAENKKNITTRVLKTELIRWKDLEFIQQSEFKQWVNDGDIKLQESLLKYQFIDPFKVWENEGVLYCLDGKHRYDDLMALEQLGNHVPDLLDATFIDCKDVTEAEELVLIYSSRYASITANGMYDFIQKYSLDFEPLKSFVDLPGLDLSILNDRFLPEPSEFVGLLKNKPLTITITFKDKQHLEDAEVKIKELLKGYEGSYHSISGGEL